MGNGKEKYGGRVTAGGSHLKGEPKLGHIIVYYCRWVVIQEVYNNRVRD